MTTLDAEQTAALYRAANRRELAEYVGELLGEVERERDYWQQETRDEYAKRRAAERSKAALVDKVKALQDQIARARMEPGQDRQKALHAYADRADTAERELAEARRRLAAVEALADEFRCPCEHGDAETCTYCTGASFTRSTVRERLVAALTPGADA